jgi:hypothetical protein
MAGKPQIGYVVGFRIFRLYAHQLPISRITSPDARDWAVRVYRTHLQTVAKANPPPRT